MPAPLIDLTASYGHEPIWKALNLPIMPGQFMALVGPADCGKSTLLKAMLATLPGSAVPDSAHPAWIWVDGDGMLPRVQSICYQLRVGYPHAALADACGQRFGSRRRWP